MGEFVASDPGPPTTVPQPTLPPGGEETFAAAFRQGNPIVSAYTAMRNSGPYQPREGYSAWDDIKDNPAYQAHQDEFAGFRSPAETQALKDRIDREERDKRILAASGASGFVASALAGTLDPTLLLPGRIAITAAKEGVGLVRGAMEVGGAMALQSGAQELALQATQETRTAGESILNVGSATVLGALLGGAAAHLSPAEHASLVAGLDAERTTMDARAAGLPEPNDPIWFHGTSAQFKNFDLDVVRRTGEPDIAIALSSSRDLARGYASKDGRIIEVKTNFKNPMIVRQEGYGSRYQNARLIEEAKAKGHDGLIFEFSDPSYLNDGTEIPPSREVLAWEAGTLVDAKTGENLLGGQKPPQPQAQSLEDRIRQAYFVVGGGKWGARVILADLRKQLPDVPREEMDRALKALNNDEKSNAVLYQNDNRTMVSPEEDAGALHIGKEPRHLLFISGPRTLEGTGFGTGFFPTSGGAAATDTREAKLVGAGGLEKLGTDPVMRGLNSPLVTARRATSDLAEVSVELKQNLKGETTTLGGGPSVETAVRVAKFTTDNAILDEMKRQWTDLRFQGQKAPWFAEFRDRMGWLSRSPELPTFEQFDKMVAEANTKNDIHAIPQVQAAAQFIRNRVAQWSDRAEQALEGFQKTTPIEGEGYFPHDWNSQLIRTQRPEFVNFLTGIFDATQRTKRDIQTRVQALNNSLASRETTIKKLTGQLERKQAKLDEDQALRDEVSKINKFAFQRATTLREGQNRRLDAQSIEVYSAAKDIAIRRMGLPIVEIDKLLNGPDATVDNFIKRLVKDYGKTEADKIIDEFGFKVAPGKNIEKARGGAVFETKVRERGNELADRASAHMHEVEELENKLQSEHAFAIEMRQKIEDEIGKWEGKSTAEAKSAIKARAKYEAERTAAAVAKGEKPPTTRLASADDAVDAAVKRILASDQNLDVEALRAKAHDTTDHILGTPDGRIYGEGAGVQFGPQLRSTDLRGSEMRRTINVSNAEAWPWINQDAQRVWRKYVNTMAPDVMIAERFGDVAMTEPIQKILDEHAALSDATKAPAERRKLDKAKDAAIRDIAGLRDRLRGVYALPQNDTQRMIGRVSAAVRNLNVPMSMGMSAVSSFGDAAGVMMRWGMTNAFRDGFGPYVQSLMTDQKLSRAALREFRTAGIAIDTQFAARHHEISGITDAYQNGSPVERALQWGADKMQLANMLGPWTDRIKTISATVAATNFLKAAEALVKGTATQKQLRALGAANIDRNLAARIAEQYRTYGNRVDGVLLPNLAEWTDRSAREAFNGALSREANIMVVTPGIDKPLLMSEPMVAMLTQFKSYTAAAHTRILIANLQRRDADALGGLVGALGLGMLSYKINALTGGQPTSDKPADWIKEGMSRSNLLGWFEEANAFSSKMTRGRLDAYRLTGSQHMLSKYAGRSALDQILGPTAGKIERLATVTGAAASMDWKASDTHAMRQLFFLQNLVYLRQLFDQVEHGVNRGLRVEEKTRQ